MATEQEEFDATYITSTEICQELNVTRASITQARKRKLLPSPIIVRGSKNQIWKRDVVRPFLDAWKLTLRARRGELA